MRLASTVAACTRIDTLVDPKVALPKAGLQACFRGAVFLRFFLSASDFRQSVLNILADIVSWLKIILQLFCLVFIAIHFEICPFERGMNGIIDSRVKLGHAVRER